MIRVMRKHDLTNKDSEKDKKKDTDNDKYIFRETPQRKILDTFETLNIFLTIENNNHSCNVFAHPASMNLPVLNIAVTSLSSQSCFGKVESKK